MIDANGNVPYDATSDSVFADASWSGSTRLGTDASLAGPQSSVRTSSANENTTSQPMLSTNGSSASSVARPMSHHTITFRRSNRSMMTPPTVPRKKPGTTRATMTRLTAAPELSDTRAAMARIAMSPIQSPVLEMTWATQSRKYDRVPKTRQGAGGTGAASGRGGMKGACWSALTTRSG